MHDSEAKINSSSDERRACVEFAPLTPADDE